MLKVLLAITILPYALCYAVIGLKLGMLYYSCRDRSPAERPGLGTLLRVFVAESNCTALIVAMRLFGFLRRRVTVDTGKCRKPALVLRCGPAPGATGGRSERPSGPRLPVVGGVRVIESPPVETPVVVFVHGYLLDASSLWVLSVRLRLSGFTTIYRVTLPWSFASIERLRGALAEDLAKIVGAHPDRGIAVVAHSMGGLVARAALRDPRLASRISRLVTIASPHHGTPAAGIGIGANARQMRVGSGYLAALGSEPPPVVMHSLYSRLDNTVFPPETTHLDGAEWIEADRVGHMGLLFSKNVAHIVACLVSGRRWDHGERSV